MTAKIIQFPGTLLAQPPRAERQVRHERMAELIVQRALRKGITVSIENARASVTRTIMEIQR